MNDASSSSTTVEAVVKELAVNNYEAIPAFFVGMSEPKRSLFRKEYLSRYSLYGTTHTIEIPLSEIRKDPMAMFQTSQREFHGSILLDLAVGNRDEIVYAIRNAAMRFPTLVMPILRERDANKFVPAVTKNLLSSPYDSFPVWGLLVENGLASMSWDDRTVVMICESGFRDDAITLPKLAAKNPEWNQIVYRMCEAENWLVIGVVSGNRAILDFVDQLHQTQQLDRLRLLRSALSGMHLVKNQNQIKGCEMIFDFLAPNLDELAECQPDLCAVMDQGKPVSFTFCLDKLEKLAAANRIDWPLLSPSLGAAFSRAGLAQSNSAIKLLQAALQSPESIEPGCHALTQALLHTKREIAERAWKTLLPVLPQANETVLQEIEQARQYVQGTLGKTIGDYLSSLGKNAGNETSVATDVASASADSDAQWPELAVQLSSLPVAVRQALRMKDAYLSAHGAKLPASFDWGLNCAAVLPTCEKLEPIQSIDELVLRIGRFAHSQQYDFDETTLILDGICRLPGSADPQFASKTAALRKNALSDSAEGLVNQFAYPDYAFVILQWLGEQLSPQLDRFIRNRFDDLAHFVVAATIPWVGEGRSFQLTSTPTHRGGWLDPQIWLDRLESAQRAGSELLLADIEQALLRLAPDGRTTPIRNRQLLDRARELIGPHASMVRYAMGDSIAWEDMHGSKRLWLAAIRGRDPSIPIPANPSFAQAVSDPCTLRPGEWQREYSNEIGDFSRPKACIVRMPSAELRRWKPTTTEMIQLEEPFATSVPCADDAFLHRFLASQSLSGDENNQHRHAYPFQLDWYWNSLLNSLILRTAKKGEVFQWETNSPWLESERPLTYESALALWLASLTKGDKSKVWLQEVWSQLVAHDRLNTPLLLTAAAELAKYQWCVPKRWAEVFAPVACRSTLHGWEIARLSMGLLGAIEIDTKDAGGFIEIIHQAYTTLNIAVTESEKAVLARYAAGKSKKSIAEIGAVVDAASPERIHAARQKFIIRWQRAQRWIAAVPADQALAIELTKADSDAETIEANDLRQAGFEVSSKTEVTATPLPSDTACENVAALTSPASTKRNSSAKKKPVSEKIALQRSATAMRLFRAAIPGLAGYAPLQSYVGAASNYLHEEVSGYARANDQYEMFLFQHLGIPVVRSQQEVTDLLQRAAKRSMVSSAEDSSMAWLASLATSLASGDDSFVKVLVDWLDLNNEFGYEEPAPTALAVAAMATRAFRTSPLTIPNSLQLHLDKDKKLSPFIEACAQIENKNVAAFTKVFEAATKKAVSEISKFLKGQSWRVSWWPSALLTILWHSARHSGLDCSAIGTEFMALVPTAATLPAASGDCPLLKFQLSDHRHQLALEHLDRILTDARVPYALTRPRVDANQIEPRTTEWAIIVDHRDELAWNRLFANYDPERCFLNADLQFHGNNDYQAVFAIMPQYGVRFQRLKIAEPLITQVIENAKRCPWDGASVCIATLEDSVGLMMPILSLMSKDPKLSQGKAQNTAYYRARLNEFKQWIISVLRSADKEILWPRIQLVAKQLEADSAVASIKAAF